MTVEARRRDDRGGSAFGAPTMVARSTCCRRAVRPCGPPHDAGPRAAVTGVGHGPLRWRASEMLCMTVIARTTARLRPSPGTGLGSDAPGRWDGTSATRQGEADRSVARGSRWSAPKRGVTTSRRRTRRVTPGPKRVPVEGIAERADRRAGAGDDGRGRDPRGSDRAPRSGGWGPPHSKSPNRASTGRSAPTWT